MALQINGNTGRILIQHVTILHYIPYSECIYNVLFSYLNKNLTNNTAVLLCFKCFHYFFPYFENIQRNTSDPKEREKHDKIKDNDL